MNTARVDPDRLLATFYDLVRIDSPSGEEGALREYLKARLEDMGLTTWVDAKGNLLGTLPGRGEPFLLNAHMDGVQPCRGIKPAMRDGVIYSDGSTILGADDRGGIAVILESLARLAPGGPAHCAVELAFTVQEEVGLLGAKALDLNLVRARQGIVLDSHGPVGGIIVATPYHNHLNAAIIGKAAHAGVAPENGLSAIAVAAEAIARMNLGRIDPETTANIGVIHGGTARNIVPERVELQGEARSRDEAKLERQTEQMVDALTQAAARAGAKIELDVERAYLGYELRPDDALVQKITGAMKRLGIEPRLEATGGGSDANIFHQHGIKVANLSVGYEDVHTTNEHVALSELVKCAQVLVEVLAGS
ncbi:MAG: M20/M25/M40 family metallo-hydrolase [Chloroflexi bacterium]|nr:M20/M25/M40 family metallo-hydrolase [Chloroflexota bacterium]